MSEKKVHLKIDRHGSSVTLEEILKEIERFQEENPDREVYFDGDEYAICSKPRDARPKEAPRPKAPTKQSPIDTVGEGEFASAPSPLAPHKPAGRLRKGKGKGRAGHLRTLDEAQED